MLGVDLLGETIEVRRPLLDEAPHALAEVARPPLELADELPGFATRVAHRSSPVEVHLALGCAIAARRAVRSHVAAYSLAAASRIVARKRPVDEPDRGRLLAEDDPPGEQ